MADLQYIDISPDDMVDVMLEPNDVMLVEASGSPELVGRSVVWDGRIARCSFANTIVRMRSEALTPEFLRIALEDHRLHGRLLPASKGVGIRHLPLSKLTVVPMPVPSLQEQSEISGNLRDRLEDLDSAKERLLSAREAAVEQVTLTLHEAALQGFSGTTDSWTSASLAELGELRAGVARDSKRPHSDPSVAYVGVAHVQEAELELSDIPSMRVPKARFDDLLLEPGDLLLTIGGNPERLGRPALVPTERPAPLSFQNHLLRFRCGPDLDPRFALLLFRSMFRSGAFSDVSRGSTNLGHLTVKDVGALRVQVPEIQQQVRIAGEADERLAALNEQMLRIEEALSRISDTERELYALATSGGLATATADPTVVEEALFAEARAREMHANRARPKRRPTAQRDGSQRLPTRLRERIALELGSAPDGVSIPDLIVRVGLNRNSVADMESLFVSLREIHDAGRLLPGDGENPVIRMLPDAPV